MKGNNYIKKKKKQEWEAIKNVITDINEYLDINIIPYNVQYENESPDFVFKNKKTCIGIEVIECHPSVQKNKKDNAPAFKSFQKRIIEEFNNNSYLNEITKEIKLNIIIDQGNALKINTKTVDVCKSLENHLRAWKEGQRCTDTKLIRKIRVIETKGRNIIQFNNISSVSFIEYEYLEHDINKKNQKIPLYNNDNDNNNKFDELWLCIHLPFEENCQFDILKDEKDSCDTFLNSPYSKIFVTSEATKDILWLKK